MNATGAFALASGAVVLMVAAATGMLWRPLGALLEVLCGSRRRGDFWLVLCVVALAAGALLLGFSGWMWPTRRAAADPARVFWSAVALFRWTVAGLLLGLAAIAAGLAAFAAGETRFGWPGFGLRWL